MHVLSKLSHCQILHIIQVFKQPSTRYVLFSVSWQGSQPEMMVSGSDDSTLFLWNPESATKPLARMTGHQQLINQVCFSPDTRLIASASFDKSVKLWDGRTGKQVHHSVVIFMGEMQQYKLRFFLIIFVVSVWSKEDDQNRMPSL